jgi:DNA-binding NarL/FixJ family response regulator
MKNLLIVEDDRLLREILTQETRSSSPGWTVRAADSLAAARLAIREAPPDAVFLDLGLPDGDGLRLVSELRALHPGCAILVITVFADEQRVLRSLEAGASGYLLKSDLPDQIGRLIATLESGGSPLSPAIARRLIERLQPGPRTAVRRGTRVARPPDDSIERLSTRENEILLLCAKGLRYAEIATTLGLSIHTVNAHLRNVYRKLMVNSRTEAIYEARRNGLLDE